ncbi:hypothetical protein HK102_009381 [Quaeritorhiza haematococci]|nr:hypothetical protein HK102_009381 [Quaeritorhiza haematococci]
MDQRFIQEEIQAETVAYFEKKQINQLLESLVVGLTYHKPEDPLEFIEDCIDQLRQEPQKSSQGEDLQSQNTSFARDSAALPPTSSYIRWDTFISPEAKAFKMRRDNARKAMPGGGGGFGLFHRKAYRVAPLGGPKTSGASFGKGTMFSPFLEVTAKPIVKRNGASAASGDGAMHAATTQQQPNVENAAQEMVNVTTAFTPGQPPRVTTAAKVLPPIATSKPSTSSRQNDAQDQQEGESRSNRPSLAASRPITGITQKAALPQINSEEPDTDGKKSRPMTESTKRQGVSTTKSVMATEHGPAWNNIVFVLGKGTQCVRIAKEFSYIHLSAGDLLRAEVAKGTDRGRELEAMMKEGKIVPMEITVSLLADAMNAAPSDANGFLIDGFPRQLDQAHAFESTIAPCKFVLFFDCPEDILEQRLLKRGETSGRADDNIETIKKRFKTFVETSYPVIEEYMRNGKCVKIDSTKSVDEVYADTKKHFETGPSSATNVDQEVQDLQPLNHPNVIFVLGGPGSGKGTQCVRLAKEFNLVHISTGDLLRAEVERGSDIGTAASELMKEGKIVPMHMILSLLRQNISEKMDAPGFLIDGFPRAMDQALEFEKTIGKCRFVLYFHCPLDVLEQRLLERGKTSGRADDNIETIRKRFETFEAQSMPVVEYFEKEGRVVKISSIPPIEEVYATARTYFASPDAAIGATDHVQTESSSPSDNGENKLPFENANIVFVLGGPGSGKGTQCDRLVEALKYAHLSTGDLLREEVKSGSCLGQEIEGLMKEGKMVPLEITLKLLIKAMEEKQQDAPGFLIDGFPRTMEQAVEFEKTVGHSKFVLFFDASEDTLVQRLLKRGETSGRADDNIESIKKRLETFRSQSLPVVEYFEKNGRVRRVTAEGTIDEITQTTMDQFKDL